MSRLLGRTRFQLGRVLSSVQRQDRCSPNSSANSNTNTFHHVQPNTSMSSLKFFSFSFSRFLTSSPNSRTTSTSNALPKEFPEKPKSITSADSDSNALPKELSKIVEVLTCESTAPGGVCKVYLVGTIHRSPESCQQVRDIINFIKPSVVFLEWDPNYARLLPPDSETLVWLKHSEFRVAFEEAKKCGARVVCGDRPMKVPISDIIAQKKLDEVIIRERDQCMCYTLLNVASENALVVAVVGEAHTPGMRQYWKQPIKVEDFMSFPSRLPQIIEYFILVLALVGVSYVSSLW